MRFSYLLLVVAGCGRTALMGDDLAPDGATRAADATIDVAARDAFTAPNERVFAKTAWGRPYTIYPSTLDYFDLGPSVVARSPVFIDTPSRGSGLLRARERLYIFGGEGIAFVDDPAGMNPSAPRTLGHFGSGFVDSLAYSRKYDALYALDSNPSLASDTIYRFDNASTCGPMTPPAATYLTQSSRRLWPALAADDWDRLFMANEVSHSLEVLVGASKAQGTSAPATYVLPQPWFSTYGIAAMAIEPTRLWLGGWTGGHPVVVGYDLSSLTPQTMPAIVLTHFPPTDTIYIVSIEARDGALFILLNDNSILGFADTATLTSAGIARLVWRGGWDQSAAGELWAMHYSGASRRLYLAGDGDQRPNQGTPGLWAIEDPLGTPARRPIYTDLPPCPDAGITCSPYFSLDVFTR